MAVSNDDSHVIINGDFFLNISKSLIQRRGFGGLVVSMLASGTQDRGFAPDRSRRIFPAGKIHSMPSFGGEVK
jgi:uncharacterized protein (DUF1786 family)